MCGAPSSSTITGAISLYWRPWFWHCLSHINLGSHRPAELLTALGMSSTPCSRPRPRPCRAAGTTFTPACVPILSAPLHSAVSANLQHCSQNLGPFQPLASQNRPRAPHGAAFLLHLQVQLHLQSFGLQTPSFHLRRLGQCPKP